MRGQKLETLVLERRLISALRKDVDCLAFQFIENKSNQLHVFADLFNKKEFSTIFLGRLSITELIEVFLFCNLNKKINVILVFRKSSYSLCPVYDFRSTG